MGNQKSLESNLSLVRQALKPFEGQYRTGAVLHRIVREAAPDLDVRQAVDMPTGPGALTKFIETFLAPLVKQVGHQGGDRLYGIGENVVTPPQIEDPDIWKAFVSPNAANSLYLRLTDHILVATVEGEQEEGHQKIERVSQDEHDQMRSAFIGTLPEGIRADFRESLSPSANYEMFLGAIREAGKAGVWGKFRRNEFRNLLSKRLDVLNIDREYHPSILYQLMTSQSAVYKKEIEDRKVTHDSGHKIPESNQPRPPSPAQSGEGTVRQLLIAVIENMSTDDLRKIRIPFGAVLDTLHTQR